MNEQWKKINDFYLCLHPSTSLHLFSPIQFPHGCPASEQVDLMSKLSYFKICESNIKSVENADSKFLSKPI